MLSSRTFCEGKVRDRTNQLTDKVVDNMIHENVQCQNIKYSVRSDAIAKNKSRSRKCTFWNFNFSFVRDETKYLRLKLFTIKSSTPVFSLDSKSVYSCSRYSGNATDYVAA